MIAYLTGKIIDLQTSELTLLTSAGIGYEVGIHEWMYVNLENNTQVELFIHHHITDNNQSLFGFLEKSEKKIFRELLKISWVGWKVAMQILTLWINNLIYSVAHEDNKMIESVKGVWKKMAEKIIIELKDKDFWIEIASAAKSENTSGVVLEKSLTENIKNTLTNMGYQPRDIDRVLWELPEWMEDVGTILPYMIRELS